MYPLLSKAQKLSIPVRVGHSSDILPDAVFYGLVAVS